jgi:hypothetical protein
LSASTIPPRLWLWPNLLSLDAPIIAALWQVFFARCFHADVKLAATILLMLAVWLIYSADRIFDARGESQLPRHEFYRRNWRAVAPVWAAVLGLAAWLACTRLSATLLERGLALTAAVAGYFAVVHLLPWRKWPKEMAVAALFAVGASLAAWGHVRSAADVVTVLLFSCLCWINCLAIEKWERRKNGCRVAVAATCVAFAAILFLLNQRPVLGAAEAASAVAFVLLDRERDRLSRDALRVLADVALLSPLLFLPIAGTLV